MSISRKSPKYIVYQRDFEVLIPSLNRRRIHNNGIMSSWYYEYMQGFAFPEFEVAVTAQFGKEIVGCCVCLSQVDRRTHTNIGVYVKNEYRRQSIGSQMVYFAKSLFSQKIVPWTGNYTAEGFYKTVKL